MTDQCGTVLLATDACSQTALPKSFAAKETLPSAGAQKINRLTLRPPPYLARSWVKEMASRFTSGPDRQSVYMSKCAKLGKGMLTPVNGIIQQNMITW